MNGMIVCDHIIFFNNTSDNHRCIFEPNKRLSLNIVIIVYAKVKKKKKKDYFR